MFGVRGGCDSSVMSGDMYPPQPGEPTPSLPPGYPGWSAPSLEPVGSRRGKHFRKTIASAAAAGGVVLFTVLKLGLLGAPAAVGVNSVMNAREAAYVEKVNAALDANNKAMAELENCTSHAGCSAAIASMLTSVNALQAAAANAPALCTCDKWGNDLVAATQQYQKGITLMQAGFANHDEATFNQAKPYMDEGDRLVRQANADRDRPGPSPS
jgi:hypothetical protein